MMQQNAIIKLMHIERTLREPIVCVCNIVMGLPEWLAAADIDELHHSR